MSFKPYQALNLSDKVKLQAIKKSPSNSKSKFWEEIVSDVKKHIDTKFQYVPSTVNKIFFAKVSKDQKRSFRIYEVECLTK